MQALRTARQALESALDSYADACLATIDRSGSGLSLSDGPDMSELMEHHTTFKQKTAHVERLLGRTRSSLTPRVPIQSLSDDVLLQIFRLVMDEELSDFEDVLDSDIHQVNILATSQVCIRWRQIALASKSLWSEIKLSMRREIVRLGPVFAHRSGDLPVNICVIEPYKGWDACDRPSIIRSFSGVGLRIASFELAMLSPSIRRPQWPKSYFYILGRILKHTVPRRLARLTLSDRNISSDRRLGEEHFESSSSAHCFFFPRPVIPQGIDTHGCCAVRIDVDLPHFEDVLAHVKVLELDAIFPLWTSRAYHGLTELRLTGPRRLTAVITMEQLAGILISSPGLRVLHFGLEVSGTEASLEPVHLRDLEIFILHSLRRDTQQAVLKLISPGQKSLQMTTMYNAETEHFPVPNLDDGFYQFFKRSNICHFELHGETLPVEIPKLLGLLPSLQTLILRQVIFEKIELRDSADTPVCPNLHTLHLRYCIFELESLRWIVDSHNLREVTLYHSEIDSNPPGEEERLMPVLLNICSFIQVLDHDVPIRIGDRALALSDIYARSMHGLVTDYMLN